MTTLKNWNSLIKLSHTLFSLPFALIGYALGYLSHPENSSLRNLSLMLLCIFFARNAAMGEALEAAYGAGHPMARLNDGLYAVLVRRDEDLGPSLARLRGHIGLAASTLHVATLVRQPPRMWVESLPGTHAYAQELIESLVR